MICVELSCIAIVDNLFLILKINSMSVFLLFQTDSWKSKASRVFFGAFDSRTKALDYAKYNDLYWYNSEVVVVEVVLNQFGEV